MRKSMKKAIVLLIAVSMAIAGMSACGSKNPAKGNANEKETAVAEGEKITTDVSELKQLTDVPKGFNYVPYENKTGKEIKIAAITVSNNPFWNAVVDGINAAKGYLSSQKVTVDVIEFDDFDGQAFSEAIDTCIVKEYDAITTVGVADTIVPAIERAAQAGIPVYTFNSDPAKASARVAFVGQDLYAAGETVGAKLVELMGEEGKVGLITGYYNVNAHELRRQGIESVLKKYAGIELVGTVENHDSGDEAYTATKDFITANPDITGIAVTAGGPHGAAKAIEELNMQDQITLVCFDTTDEIIAYLEKGIIDATITQDPFGQGCDPIVLAYNQILSGKAEVTGNAFTAMNAYTPDNVGELTK